MLCLMCVVNALPAVLWNVLLIFHCRTGMAHKPAVALLCICVPCARMQLAVFVCGVGVRGGKVFRRDELLLLRLRRMERFGEASSVPRRGIAAR